jgi:hypothetical protein
LSTPWLIEVACVLSLSAIAKPEASSDALLILRPEDNFSKDEDKLLFVFTAASCAVIEDMFVLILIINPFLIMTHCKTKV